MPLTYDCSALTELVGINTCTPSRCSQIPTPSLSQDVLSQLQRRPQPLCHDAAWVGHRRLVGTPLFGYSCDVRIYPAINPKCSFDTKVYSGKVVLVTGASRGIGQTTALFYAKAGAAVALVARSSLEATQTMITKEVPGAKILAFTADVTDSARAEEVVRATVEQFGKLDILIANAGTGSASKSKRKLASYALSEKLIDYRYGRAGG
jgi:hypothetical protein